MMPSSKNLDISRHHATADRVIYLRGWYLLAFAQIEFLLGELISISLVASGYDDLGDSLPHGAPDRMLRAKRILGRAGPMSRFASSFEPVFAKFERSIDDRNMIAHGYSELLISNDGEAAVRFLKWQRDKVGRRQDLNKEVIVPVSMLEREAEEISEISETLIQAFYAIRGDSVPLDDR